MVTGPLASPDAGHARATFGRRELRFHPTLMPPLRVGLDYRCALLTHAGIARSVRELVRALAARDDVEVHLYGHSVARARCADPIPERAHLHRWPLPSRALPHLHRLGLGPEHFCGRVRIFHWTDYIYPPLVSAQGVVTVHDLAFAVDPVYHGERMSRELLARCRDATTRAALVVVPTQATARAAREHLALPAAKVRVVPFGADHVPERDLGQGDEVLMLGTIEPRKNHARVLAAWQLLPRPRPRLRVVGRVGWECDTVVQALIAAEQRGDLVWQREASDAEVRAALARAQLLLYPSLLEGFGFPPLEAMRSGIPVLAGDTPALREVLDDGALFCDPREPAAIADGIARALADHALRTRLRRSGRARAASLRWADAAAGYAAGYRELQPA